MSAIDPLAFPEPGDAAPASPDLPAPVPRPRRADVRRRLLRAASEIFSERGFSDSKLDDIARRAGLSKGAVYSNFASKQAVFGALLAARVEVMREVIGAAKDPGNTAAAGSKAGAAVLENIVADAALARLVLEFAARAGHDEKAREIYLPFLRAQHELAAHAWRGIDTSGRRPPEPADADLIGVILVALRNGLALAHAADPAKIDAELMEQAMKTTVTALLLGNASSPGGEAPGC